MAFSILSLFALGSLVFQRLAAQTITCGADKPCEIGCCGNGGIDTNQSVPLACYHAFHHAGP